MFFKKEHTMMKLRCWSVVTAILAFAILQLRIPTAFAQGSLTPPGPPAPVMKSLDQIEARTPILSLPFTITRPGAYYLTTNLTGVSGASGVTIATGAVTLDLNGFALFGPAGSSNGVFVSVLATNLTIRNGSLSGWDGTGVEAYNGENVLLERLAVSDTGGFGIDAYGGVVRDCRVDTSADTGLVAYLSDVEHCIVENCGYDGIDAYNSQVRHCVVENCDYGIYAAPGTVADCVIGFSSNSGLYLGGDGCQITGNTCVTNNLNRGSADAGIFVASNNNRLENNHVTGSGHAGIQVASAGAARNLILKNSVMGSGANNFITPGTQIIGPIITATGTISSTSPWANFSY